MKDLAEREAHDKPIPDNLRDLIERCIADDATSRPALDSLTKECEDEVRQRTEQDFKRASTDLLSSANAAVRRWVQHEIFDAMSGNY
jgi:hypothetical protein